MTGCLDLSLKSLYSGVNNYNECTVFSDVYFYDCYGFTEDELNEILNYFKKFNKPNVRDMIKKTYDGYSFISNTGIIKNIYNPYSIMKFIQLNKEINDEKNYKYSNFWVHSGENSIIRNTLKKYDYIYKKKFLNLLYGNVIIVKLERTLILKNNYLEDDIWTILFRSGYITLADENEYEKNIEQMDDQIIKLLNDQVNDQANDQKNNKNKEKKIIEMYRNKLLNISSSEMYYVKIPNNEILTFFINLFEVCLQYKDKEFKIKDKNIEELIKAIYEYNIYDINEKLNNHLLKFSSHHLFKRDNEIHENAYQVLLMQIFIIFKIDGLTAEKDSGLGRYDFGFPNKNKKMEKEYILIEVKVCKSDKKINLNNECKNAIEQIENKKYDEEHRNNGYNSIIKYGIAFYKKTCRVLMKKNDGPIEGPSDDDNSNSSNNNHINNSKG